MARFRFATFLSLLFLVPSLSFSATARLDSDFSRGLLAYQNGDWRSAVLHLKRAVLTENQGEDAMFLLIRSEINANERELALSDCEDFLRLYDSSVYHPLVLFLDEKSGRFWF